MCLPAQRNFRGENASNVTINEQSLEGAFAEKCDKPKVCVRTV